MNMIKRFIIYTLVVAITYSSLPASLVMAQTETASSLQFEIDNLKNQILKLQSDVYTKEESGEDPECSTTKTLQANIEGEILAAETRGKTIRSEVERKREDKKKLETELAFYDRMFLNSAEKTAIYGVAALAGVAGMVALGVDNAKIQKRLESNDYTREGAAAIQAAGEISVERIAEWEVKCKNAATQSGENISEAVADCQNLRNAVLDNAEQEQIDTNKTDAELQNEMAESIRQIAVIKESLESGDETLPEIPVENTESTETQNLETERQQAANALIEITNNLNAAD
ncbi:MAG: hypothetical protein LBU68_00725 [Rickettsiales bacterium]|jgi:DNA-binding protein|nr:hypothetical protein [Rickettsiales bacterium]